MSKCTYTFVSFSLCRSEAANQGCRRTAWHSWPEVYQLRTFCWWHWITIGWKKFRSAYPRRARYPHHTASHSRHQVTAEATYRHHHITAHSKKNLSFQNSHRSVYQHRLIATQSASRQRHHAANNTIVHPANTTQRLANNTRRPAILKS